MTKKLKIKFIAIIMSIMTIMLCIIMSMIWFFTKRNLESDSIHMMQNIADRPFLLHPPEGPSEDMRLPFIVLELGKHKELLTAQGGYYDLSDESFLDKLIDSAFSDEAPVGLIKDYRLRFLRMDTPAGYVLVYADISSEQAVLRSLLGNCIFIGLACFLIFFCISFLLAGWIVKPADRAWRQQRQFIADASHELKTPLTVIMANAELLQSPGQGGNSHAVFSSNILAMSRQMRSLVEQLLELARADDAGSHIVLSTFDFSRLISKAILPFEPVFFERGLTLQTDIEEGILVRGAPDKLRQVLDILLDNAQKYSCESGTTWVALQVRGRKHCLLTVANEGDAIPAENLNNLFKRFYRADKARTHDGSFGLGLSIAESVVTYHGGKIWADSKNGVNTFYVKLGRVYHAHRPPSAKSAV